MDCWIFFTCDTAKRILKRLGIQTSSSFVKIWWVCIPKFKANFLFFWHLYGLGFFSRIYWSWLDHDRIASIWEKAISILAENLNSGRSYLITAVFEAEGMFALSFKCFWILLEYVMSAYKITPIVAWCQAS